TRRGPIPTWKTSAGCRALAHDAPALGRGARPASLSAPHRRPHGPAGETSEVCAGGVGVSHQAGTDRWHMMVCTSLLTPIGRVLRGGPGHDPCIWPALYARTACTREGRAPCLNCLFSRRVSVMAPGIPVLWGRWALRAAVSRTSVARLG